ncbi:hypothetical protein ACHQM5_010313 [Ranunculus cassubicifolius]
MDFSPLYLEHEMLDRVPNSTCARCISLCPKYFSGFVTASSPALCLLHGAAGDVVPRYPNIFCGATTRDNYMRGVTTRGHSIGHIDELVVEILSWLEKTDLATCEEVCPRWKHLINNDAQFLALHPCRGGDWKNRPPRFRSRCICKKINDKEN